MNFVVIIGSGRKGDLIRDQSWAAPALAAPALALVATVAVTVCS